MNQMISKLKTYRPAVGVSPIWQKADAFCLILADTRLMHGRSWVWKESGLS